MKIRKGLEMGTSIRAAIRPWANDISLLVTAPMDGVPGVLPSQRGIGRLAIIELIEDAGAICEPTCTINRTEAQVLMDDLWACGIRPTEGAGSAGSLKATERHLEDMRRIAFELLIEKPERIEVREESISDRMGKGPDVL